MTSPVRATHVALAVPAVAVAMLVGVLVAPVSANHDTKTDDPRALELLSQAMVAPTRVSYTGTQFVAAWSAVDPSTSTSALVDVEHIAGRATVVNAHGSQPMAVLDQPVAAAWLAEGNGPIGLLNKAYDVVVTGVADVAGRATYVLEAQRSDGTIAARLWLDQEYGLPLRREVYDEAGSTLSASAFVEIDLRDDSQGSGPLRSDSDTRLQTLGRFVTAPESLGHRDLDELRDRGWHCPAQLTGGLALYEAKLVGEAVQLSYSDGVVTMSVFEQPGTLDPETLNGFTEQTVGDGVVYRAPGPPSQYVWESGGYVVTVVADSSVSTIEAVLEAMPPDATKSSGLLGRISRGAQRLVAWANPFS